MEPGVMKKMVKAKGQEDKDGREDHGRRQELECVLEVFDELLRVPFEP